MVESTGDAPVISLKDRKERYRTLVLPHVPLLYRVAHNYVRNSYDAEDLVQETCYLALKNLHQLRDDPMAKAWLCRILRNAFLRTLRPSKRLRTEEWIDEAPEDLWQRSAAATDASFERREQARVLVDGLAEHYKSALLLHTVGGFTYEQIAEILDVPIGTVMSRISRAKRQIRERLEAAPGARPALRVVHGGDAADTGGGAR